MNYYRFQITLLFLFAITALIVGAEIPQNLIIPPASTTETSLTICWDKPLNDSDTVGYEIYLNHRYIGYTKKTNYTVENLLPDNSYTIGVKSIDKMGNASSLLELPYVRTRKQGIILNILDYGAIGDGVYINTAKIQQAINDCPNGGTVYIPEGTFLSGALFLKSNINLYIAKGGILQGSSSPKHYEPYLFNRFEGWEMETYSSLLNAGRMDRSGQYHAENISIRGKGVIQGGGATLGNAMVSSKGMRSRGRLICLMNCRNVCIQGLTIQNSPCWTIHYIYSRDITLYDLTINSTVRNGDGIDPDSSINNYIFNCTFDTNDDCIAIKSGKNPEGFYINKPSKKVYISYCSFIQGHGISIGSEMSGGVEDVIIRDCIAGHLKYGMQIKVTKERGGYVKNVSVKDCDLQSIRIFTSVPYNNDGKPAPLSPYIQNLSFINIDMTRAVRKDIITVEGFADKKCYSKKILFKNILLPEGAEIEVSNSSYICFDNVKFDDDIEPRYIVNRSSNIKIY